MLPLRALIVGATPGETAQVEQALENTGCLERSRSIGLEQALERSPDWDNWNLVIARYRAETENGLFALIAPVVRKLTPPVIFLVDSFDPLTVARLMNAGGLRVLPIDQLHQVLALNIGALTGLHPQTTVGDADRRVDHIVAEPGEGFVRLFRSSPVGIAIYHLADDTCLDCNESFAGLLEWPREAIIGHNLLELSIPTEMKEALVESGRKDAPADRLNFKFERKIFTASRQIRHVQIHLDRIEWSGEPCTLVLVQDISEKEQAKAKVSRLNDELEKLVLTRTAALEAANRELAAEIARRKELENYSSRLAQIIWETPDVVFIANPDGCLDFLNKAGRNLFQLREDEPLARMDLFSMYPPDMRAWISHEILPQVINEGIWRGETQFALPEGRCVPLSQVILCEKDECGQVLFFASIGRDISDTKSVETELRSSRERYRILAEAAQDFIFMVSKDGVMEYANEFACKALSFDPALVSGTPASEFFPRDFASNHLEMFSEVHEINRPVYTEGPFLREGGESWLGTWLVPVYTLSGGLTSILGISRDITEQKRTDEALQKALQNERQLNEMHSNFFSMTSHQFRTPLGTILLCAEMLQKYGAGWDFDRQREQLVRISESALRMNSLLDDILLIGRVDSGRYTCTPKDFDLVSFIDEIALEIGLNDRDEHTIVFQHSIEQLPVYLDPDILRRVVDNLLSNAVKYSPSGSEVQVGIRVDGDWVQIDVTDQGIGIPDRDLEYLFQPFQRGSNAADFPGAGIGLAIIQKSVELLHGTVTVKSKEGQGTTFTVSVPLRY